MRVFLDERCLTGADLVDVLRLWRQIADLAATNAPGLSLFLDGDAVRSGVFLQGLNALSHDVRMLYSPMVFGSDLVNNWRPIAIAPSAICKLATEDRAVTNCAVCEVYGHGKTIATVALLGHDQSSYSHCQAVGVAEVATSEAPITAMCGVTLADFRRIASAWHCLLVEYDLGLNRPPRDDETVLGLKPDRFAPTGRFERNGRRRVYRETATNRLFYVDNLHYGNAAHLEVFSSDKRHLGTADLDGNLDVGTRVPGRTISW
jgi:hypothetical protein